MITNLALVPLWNTSVDALVLIALIRVKLDQTSESLYYCAPLTRDTTLERTLQLSGARTMKHKRRRRTQGPLSERKIKTHHMWSALNRYVERPKDPK